MGYLGLSDPVEKQDNLFQRLFWPSDHAGEVDSLGQQGFWLCILVGVLSFTVLLTQGHLAIATLSLLFFPFGGIGVREHSTIAAVLVALAYVMNIVDSIIAGRAPGILSIAAAMLLLANIRGTWLAARWMKRGDPDDFPVRMNETWRDRLVDQMRARVWPGGKIAFFSVAALYMVLTVLGTAVIVRQRTALSTPAADIITPNR